MNLPRKTNRRERGQLLVIVAVGMVAIIAMVGVVIDGGYAWGKQRETQNGADSTSEAGAVKLAENLAYTSRGFAAPNTDADVLAAVNSAGAANDIGSPDAYYTDFSGNLIGVGGNPAPNRSAAAKVGGGAIPPGSWGVRAYAQQTFDTFLARAIGFDQLTAATSATARAGYLTSVCSAQAGCAVLPITVPVTVLGCDGQNNPDPIDPPEYWEAPGPVLTVPLCKNGPGNVGWLDWTPTSGGTDELVQAIANPSNPYIKWPGWYYITATGNINSADVENALRTHDGEVVQFPQFDSTCDALPTGPGVNDCPAGHVGGTGSNQWYHLAGMSGFEFCIAGDADCDAAGLAHGAYINGNNEVPCDTGNGGTSCLAGRFIVIVYEGEVAASPPPNPGTAAVGVQLIQ